MDQESQPKAEREVDDGQRPEMAEKMLRLLDTAKNIEGFEGKSVEEIFGNEVLRREFILKLPPEKYEELLVGINGILRNRNRYEWGMDGKEVVIGSHDDPHWDFPAFEDKPQLLSESLLAAKKMVEDGAEIEDIAMLLAVTLSATHPFNDGNGRTAKFLLTMVNKGYSKDERKFLDTMLTSSEVSNLVNPSSINGHIRAVILEEIGMINTEGKRIDFEDEHGVAVRSIRTRGIDSQFDGYFNESVSEAKKAALKQAFIFGPTHMFPALFEYIKKDADQYTVDGNLRFDITMKSLTNQGIDTILETWKFLKKRHVELIIDCIANPTKEEYELATSKQKAKNPEEKRFIYDHLKLSSRRGADDDLVKEMFG